MPRTVPTLLFAPVLVIVGEVPRPVEVGPLVTDHLRPRVIPFYGGGAAFRSHCPASSVAVGRAGQARSKDVQGAVRDRYRLGDPPLPPLPPGGLTAIGG